MGDISPSELISMKLEGQSCETILHQIANDLTIDTINHTVDVNQLSSDHLSTKCLTKRLIRRNKIFNENIYTVEVTKTSSYWCINIMSSEVMLKSITLKHSEILNTKLHSELLPSDMSFSAIADALVDRIEISDGEMHFTAGSKTSF